MPETRPIETWSADFNVDEVPEVGAVVPFLRGVPIGISIPVGPCSGTRDVVRGEVIRIGREERADLRSHRGLQIILCDQRDRLVTAVTPSEGRPWLADQDARDKGKHNSNDGSAHVSNSPGDFLRP